MLGTPLGNAMLVILSTTYINDIMYVYYSAGGSEHTVQVGIMMSQNVACDCALWPYSGYSAESEVRVQG
ncbi:hypothetical protein XELAEV_18013118mg [Xenopus laevis]|uniref:Uncharacterized protein n=1 Tax=Xenopus laevis TaxID=8355 RepID=A0A974DQA4_XENLA|nr:hypothetical protein XELAEV_18013118mg [Xenopus laevis]